MSRSREKCLIDRRNNLGSILEVGQPTVKSADDKNSLRPGPKCTVVQIYGFFANLRSLP